MNISAVVNSDGSVDLTGKQGGTWTFTVTAYQSTGGPVLDLTGYSARGQIRKTYASTDIIKSFTFSIPSPTTGVVNVSMAASDTTAIPAGKLPTDSASTYVYDIEIHTGSPETVTRLMEGRLFIDPQVTR